MSSSSTIRSRKPPDLFEVYLPFALALDVEQSWSERFASVFRDMAQRGETYQPGWYHGSHWNADQVGSFASAVGSSLSAAISSSSTAPGSSSGGRGGGSSGGSGGAEAGGAGWYPRAIVALPPTPSTDRPINRVQKSCLKMPLAVRYGDAEMLALRS
jgi:uncharacterized membrane protein